MSPCGSCKNRRFKGTYRLHLQCENNQSTRNTSAVDSDCSRLGRNKCVVWLLVTANVPGSLILVTLMMEATRSSETSVLTRATRRTIPDDGILHSHSRENLKYYKYTFIIICKEIFNYVKLVIKPCSFFT
jgi:hypothetical protein